MKVNRHGRAKILSPSEIQLLFTQGLTKERDRVLFGICLFSGCRINEACTLLSEDVYSRRGKVYDELTFRKGSTKGKLATRSIPVADELRSLLCGFYPNRGNPYLFAGRWGRGHITSDSAARILRRAFAAVGIEGSSTHSFRRTALTQMSDTGIPLRVVQEISGHRNLDQLQKYLEVHPDRVKGAIASLSMLAPIPDGNSPLDGSPTPVVDRTAPLGDSPDF